MELIEALQDLPYELFENIRRLTYKPQPKELLNDIMDYYTTKMEVSRYYYNKYKKNNNTRMNIDKLWLENDINYYLNHKIPIIRHIEDKYINIIKRLFLMKNKSDYDIVMFITNKIVYTRDIEKQINFLWGLMNKVERREMMSFYTSL